jgi:predicted secreted protein
MGFFEAVVVFVISWWLIFLPILSAGTRSQHEENSVVPGTERAAPVKTGMPWKLAVASGGAVVVTGLVWLTLRMGWLESLIR